MALELSDISKINFDSIKNFDLGMVGVYAWFMIQVLFWVALVIIGIYLVWRYKYSYKIKCLLFRPVGNGGIKWWVGRAKVMTDANGGKILYFDQKFGGHNLVTPLSPAVYRLINGSTDSYAFRMDDNYNLHPVIFKDDPANPAVQAIPQQLMEFFLTQTKRRVEKYSKKDFWEKYLPSVVVLASFVISFLIAYFATQHIAGSMAQIAGSLAQLASAISSLGAK